MKNDLIIDLYGKKHKIMFWTDSYVENGNLYVGMVTDSEEYGFEPWGDLTVNIGIVCDNGCAFIDTNNNGQTIVDWLVENKMGQPTGRVGRSGWCTYPEFRFDVDELSKHFFKRNKGE